MNYEYEVISESNLSRFNAKLTEYVNESWIPIPTSHQVTVLGNSSAVKYSMLMKREVKKEEESLAP